MVQRIKTLGVITLLFITCSCNPLIDNGVHKRDLNKDIEMTTNYGVIVFRLSDETPLHRNNFLRLVNQHFYDSLLFHRVINHFVVQTGDPKSKKAGPDEELGDTDLPYTIPTEFRSNLFHKRGALNAARNGDDENPLQASSSTQFTFVQGKIYTDSTLNIAENRINYMQAYNRVIRKPENRSLVDLQKRINDGKAPQDSLSFVKNELKRLTEVEMAHSVRYKIPENQRLVYKTIGGAAHLDQNYTVFGEIISGLPVVDSIAKVKTNKSDRPLKEVRIISVRLVKRK